MVVEFKSNPAGANDTVKVYRMAIPAGFLKKMDNKFSMVKSNTVHCCDFLV